MSFLRHELENILELSIGLMLVPMLTRVTVAAFIVIIVAKLVVRLGPSMGGLIAGLPVGLGPGFYFLMLESDTSFLYESALYSLVALSATQVFLLAYLILAKFFKPLSCALFSVVIWILLASSLYQFNFNLLQAVFFFGFSTIVTRYVGSFFVGKELVEKKAENDLILFLRAVVGGIIISFVTVFASRLGSHLSGILLAFPIAYILISFNIHKVFGKSIVTGVVYSALFGTVSLAVFCVAFTILLQMVPLIYVLVLSLFGSVFVTALMLILEAKIAKNHLSFINPRRKH